MPNTSLAQSLPPSVFPFGLNIPYFQGITKHSQDNPTLPSGVGSYMKLQGTSDNYNFLRNPTGASVSFWIHVPALDGIFNGFNEGSVSSLFRLVLANENVGIDIDEDPLSEGDDLRFDPNGNFVKGMIMGFTRDRRITQGLPPSNNNFDNPAEHISFFVAPTRSLNSSAASFIPRKYDANYEPFGVEGGYYSMIQNIWQVKNNLAFSSCGKEFCNVAVTFNPTTDKIKFYLDGQLFTTSSMSYCMASQPNQMPNIPYTTKGINYAFKYDAADIGQLAPTSLRGNPSLNSGSNIPYHTPWIVGGGYTDGMATKGNFMGGEYGGVISGLRGFIGFLMFYNRPLTDNEVLGNYNIKRDDFKSVVMPNLMWEPIKTT